MKTSDKYTSAVTYTAAVSAHLCKTCVLRVLMYYNFRLFLHNGSSEMKIESLYKVWVGFVKCSSFGGPARHAIYPLKQKILLSWKSMVKRASGQKKAKHWTGRQMDWGWEQNKIMRGWVELMISLERVLVDVFLCLRLVAVEHCCVLH